MKISSILAALNPRKFSKFSLLALFVLIGFFLFFHINLVAVGNGSEMRAQMAREMWQSHHYFIPVLNGHYKLTKPPLYYDWVMLFYALSGQATLFWARLSSIVASMLLLGSVGWYSLHVLKVRHSRILVSLLFFTPMYLYCSRRAEMEILLSLEIFLAYLFLHLGLLKHSRVFLLLAYFFVAVIFFTKGPIVFLFMIFWALLYAGFRGWGALWAQIRRSWSLSGLLVAGLIFVFFFYQFYKVRHLYIQTAVSEVGLRFPFADYLHHPWKFFQNFLFTNPLAFLLFAYPLSFFLPFLLAKRSKLNELPLIAALGIILSIFCFNEVIDYYYLPAFPFLAIGTARLLDSAPGPWVRRLLLGASIVNLVLINAVFFLLKDINGVFIMIGFLLFSLVFLRLEIAARDRVLFLLVSLGCLYFTVINFIEPLDISNDRLLYYRQIAQEFNLSQSKGPIYSMDNEQTAFDFGLQKKIKALPKDAIIANLERDGQMLILLDDPAELAFLQQDKHVTFTRQLPFLSKLVEQVYPRIPWVNWPHPYYVFAQIQYKK